ncbi:YaaC family protein [Clostridium sp. BSD9I1]|uniref:YaaC family protein n=1 Tax=Clostridium sp. BSD9I1 TaxID=2003589 RepID=UPI0016492175|nr:YaaC family protein [Clostridium sp. BSD9I1]
MPRRTELCIDTYPFQFKNKSLQMKKAYSSQDYQNSTVLTDDIFTYINFYFSSHKKCMKYHDLTLKDKHGDPNKYHFSFYWKQAMSFYKAAKTLPIESSPLASYYSMLNAVKALIAFREPYVDNFINNFSAHGLFEDKNGIGQSLDTIGVQRVGFGVFVEFGKLLESNFEVLWPRKSPWTLQKLLYNLAFLHRAYVTTYTTPRGRKIQELFVPVKAGTAPMYYKGNDNCLYMKFEIEKYHFPPTATSIPTTILSSISNDFIECGDNPFFLHSTQGARRNTDSISGELKILNTTLRKQFQYIKSSQRLWYLRRSNLGISKVINVNSMLIIMATMHRFSEIVRYKPEQLARLMDSKENWLVHEFLSLALDQFIDEISAEITGQDIMSSGIKNA